MEFFKQNTQINFMRQRGLAAAFSVLIFIASVVSLAINGLNMGLDFSGGTQVELHFKHSVSPNLTREILEKASFHDAAVIRYGSSRDLQITLSSNAKTEASPLKSKLSTLFPDAEVTRIDFVGPSVGKQLASQGLLAVIVSLIATMIYIAIRFEYRFAVSSTVALIHDPILILGIFAFFHIEFNLISLAALLTVLGYSLNDTIVIFDRVRENFRKLREETPWDIVNISINQTLSRTIMTSGLTLLAVIVLFIYGGAMIHGFALALIIGIIIGTYSSIYIAGALAVAMGLSRKDLLPAPKSETLEERP